MIFRLIGGHNKKAVSVCLFKECEFLVMGYINDQWIGLGFKILNCLFLGYKLFYLFCMKWWFMWWLIWYKIINKIG